MIICGGFALSFYGGIRSVTQFAGKLAFFFIVFSILAARSLAEHAETSLRYVDALRRQGMSDLAVDYLEEYLKRDDVAAEDRPELEFELAASLVTASKSAGEIPEREKKLNQAHDAFLAFGKKYSDHPRRAEALVQQATIELERGRIRVLEAQLPSNEAKATELAKQARELFAQSSKDYETAHAAVKAQLEKMTGFIDEKKDRALYRQRERYFVDEVESQFQAGLAEFFIADSYAAIDYRGKSPKGVKEYKQALSKALATFGKISEEHRRELAGLYGQLWSARCLVSLGEFEKANILLDGLLQHDNSDLATFQRQVFHFRLLSLAAQNKPREIVSLATEWLKDNIRHRMEGAYQGVQMATAEALISLGKESKEEKETRAFYRQANEILSDLVRYPNSYTGQATREQLALSRVMNRDVKATSFYELSAQANARLDELRPDMPADDRKKLLDEVIAKLEQSIKAAEGKAEPDDVGTVRMTLAFAFLQNGDVAKAAALADSLARTKEEFSRAGEAGVLALTAYANLYDQAKTKSGGEPDANEDRQKIESLAQFMIEKWPKSPSSDQARLLLGKLSYAEKDYPKAAALLDGVNPEGDQAAQAISFAGLAYWQQVLLARQQETTSAEAITPLRTKASDRLVSASAKLKSVEKDGLSRDRFRNDTVLAEVFLDASEPAKSLETLTPIVTLIKAKKEPAGLDPNLRVAAIVASIRAYLDLGQVDKTKEMIALIDVGDSQKGTEKGTASVTKVLVSLAKSLRDQMDRRAAEKRPMTDKEISAYATFLDGIAARDSGQTPGTLTFLADAFLAIHRPAQAVTLLEKASASPDADANTRTRARMLLARGQSLTGKHDTAKSLISELLKENPNSRDVIFEKGEIYEAAKDWPGAIKHWQWFLDRLKRVQPRPAELYQVTDRLSGLYVEMSKSATGEDKKKLLSMAYRLPSYLLETDKNIPDEWKKRLQSRVTAIKPYLGS